MYSIHPYGKHCHNHLLAKHKTRDFHKVAIELFKNIPDSEKENHVKSFNSLIQKWHYMPAESWTNPENGIWIQMGCYLGKHFSDMDKYKNLADIFNDTK